MDYTTIISLDDVATAIGVGGCRVFDCSFDLTNPGKGREIYASAHLPGARYLHLDDDLAGSPSGTNGRHPLPDPEIFAAKLRAEGLNSDEQIFVYDNAGGPFAARLWWMMRWLGHDKVAVMDGNVADWQAAGHEVAFGSRPNEKPGNFEAAALRSESVVDADFVFGTIDSGEDLILDARSGPRFRGEVLLMDAVAGHIPGARNRPFTDNLGADGRFKSRDSLRSELQDIIAGFTPANVILQCGSGVTACHNALAMEHASLTGSRLYPGSWSEWVSDPARPVAVDTPLPAPQD